MSFTDVYIDFLSCRLYIENRDNAHETEVLGMILSYKEAVEKYGNEYKLWFFDGIVGGMPSGEAYKTFTGTGKVHSIRRAVPSNITNMVIQMGPRAAMPIFPTSE